MSVQERTQCLLFVELKGALRTLADVRTGGSALNRTDYEVYALIPFAVKNGNAEVSCRLAANGVEVIACDRDYPSLQSSVKADKVEIIEILLEHDSRSRQSNNTALHIAINNVNKEVIKQLFPVDMIAHPHPSYLFDELKSVSAVDEENAVFLERLLSFKADIKIAHPGGRTLLHLAASRGQETLVQLLLRCGVNIEARNVGEETPLHMATSRGHAQIVEMLLSNGANVDAETITGATPLEIVADCGMKPSRSLARAHSHVEGGNVARNILQDRPVVENFSPEIVEIILSHRPSLENASNKKAFCTALSAYGGKWRIFAEKMLAYGFSVASNEVNFQLLFGAIHHNFFDLVQKIYSYGVDMYFYEGVTPLHEAAEYADAVLIKFILNQGADINAPCSWGRTPLIAAAENGKWGNVKLLVRLGAKIDDVDASGRCAFYIACEKGSLDDVEFFIKNGADLNIMCTGGETPIFAAVKRGELKVIETLLNCGALAYVKDRNETTILHLAVRNEHLQVLQVLLEHSFLDNGRLMETDVCRIFGRAYGKNNNIAWYLYDERSVDRLGEIALVLSRHVSKANAVSTGSGELMLGPTMYRNDASVLAFRDECASELSEMKNEYVIESHDVSFYEILKSDMHWISYLLRNGEFAEALDAGVVKYPIYAGALNQQIQKGLFRNELIRQVVEIRRSSFLQFSALPVELKEQILQHLSNRELMILKTVCTE